MTTRDWISLDYRQVKFDDNRVSMDGRGRQNSMATGFRWIIDRRPEFDDHWIWTDDRLGRGSKFDDDWISMDDRLGLATGFG